MPPQTCYIFLDNDYADWEIALVMAGLHRFSDIKVITFAFDDAPVHSMGTFPSVPTLPSIRSTPPISACSSSREGFDGKKKEKTRNYPTWSGKSWNRTKD
jgi:hypothetical protein